MNLSHYKIEFGFGVGKDRDQKTITPERVTCALEVIAEEAVRKFGAYTLTATEGGWVNPAGVLVMERGYTLMATVANPHEVMSLSAASALSRNTLREYNALKLAIKNMAAIISGALRQEAVAVTVTPVYFSMEFCQA